MRVEPTRLLAMAWLGQSCKRESEFSGSGSSHQILGSSSVQQNTLDLSFSVRVNAAAISDSALVAPKRSPNMLSRQEADPPHHIHVGLGKKHLALRVLCGPVCVASILNWGTPDWGPRLLQRVSAMENYR